MPNKLSQFWQELKRRRVIHVIIVYATAAYIIIELVTNIAEPLNLPNWTPTMVIVLLAIGFPIAIIFSWIFDVTPEGVQKTKPIHKVKKEDKPVTTKNWKIASYISFVVIVGLILLNIIPRINRSDTKEIHDKSIAVIPFISLSDDPEKQYLADGVMDAILLHLSKIEDLRVMARISVEQYRDTDKTATEICEELDVAFLLEGNFRKYGDQARLILQLIQPGKEDHVWANEYDREWKDIFAVESEVAQLVAKELQAVITPEEKLLIEKIPTTNLTAYDFYQRGKAELEKDWSFFKTAAMRQGDDLHRNAIERAETLYFKALEHDSTFALAYTGLAWVYWYKNFWGTMLTEQYLDSVIILADVALSLDDQLSEAYSLKGFYYLANKKRDQAMNEFDRAIKYNPNDWKAYGGLFVLHYTEDDYTKSIENLYKATSLYRGSFLPSLYSQLAELFSALGFWETSEKYLKEVLALDNDSAKYYNSFASLESNSGNFKKSIELFQRSNAIDSTNSSYFMIGNNYTYLGQYEEALVYYKKAWEIHQAIDIPEQGAINTMLRLGQSYLMIGKDEEASYYLNRTRELLNEIEDLDRLTFISEIHKIYTLIGMYTCLGDNNNAFKNLRILNQKKQFPIWIITQLKIDPLFNNIRDEPEFQQIVSEVEAKFKAEHERVRKWLEENDML